MSGGKGGSQATLYLRCWLKWGTGEGPLCMNHFPFSSEPRKLPATGDKCPCSLAGWIHTPFHTHSQGHKCVPIWRPPTLAEGHTQKSRWRPRPSGHGRLPTLPLTPTAPHIPTPAMAQAHRTLEAPVGGPSRSPAASPASSWNPRALPGDGGWPSPGVHVTCPENRGHDTGAGLPSQAHHPHFTDE